MFAWMLEVLLWLILACSFSMQCRQWGRELCIRFACTFLWYQDRFKLMGWPVDELVLDEGSMTSNRVSRLIGEGLHLGCLGTILYSIFLASTAPWWDPSQPGQRIDPAQQQEAKPAKRRRQTGGVGRKSRG